MTTTVLDQFGKRVSIPANPRGRVVLATTCGRCHQLLPDESFRKRTSGLGDRAYSWCLECTRRATKPSTPSQNAEQALKRGAGLQPPRSLPYRALAKTCPLCGTLITTPDHLIRKDAGSLRRCAGCAVKMTVRYQKKRKQEDPEFRRRYRLASDRRQRVIQAETIQSALRAGKEWTGPELAAAAREDLSARQVAELIGRSLFAVKHIRRKLAVDPRYYRRAS